MKCFAALLLLLLLAPQPASHASIAGGQSIAPYPKVVIYTTPWCTSCTAAKEYFLKNNIPFVKKDIDANDRYLDEMTGKYKSRSVPLIVIGRDQKVLHGFIPELFQQAFRDVMTTSSR
jgi:glutaredoxin